jgi:hypothetical protein
MNVANQSGVPLCGPQRSCCTYNQVKKTKNINAHSMLPVGIEPASSPSATHELKGEATSATGQLQSTLHEPDRGGSRG